VILRGMNSLDIAIIGGGIAGCSAAALLAEAGASVALFERDEIGAAASGRNSGAIQHPFDPELTALHWETLELYRSLTLELPDRFALPAEPSGLLVLSPEEPLVAEMASTLAAEVPELAPAALAPAELARLEPLVAEGLAACRLETAYAIPPAGATSAFAALAELRGARIETGHEAALWMEQGRACGVTVNGRRQPAGAVLVAAGPWTPGLLAGLAAAPVDPVWGVTVRVELPYAPRHVLEQAGVELADPSAGAVAPEGDQAPGVPSLFSLVTAAGASTLGSTFLPSEPDPSALAEPLRERGAEFVPALRDAPVLGTRVCPRPQSADGRPLVGSVPGVEGLYVVAGHGPWGISIGPASARLVSDVVLGRAGPVPAALDPARFAS
jgi:D-amino-acid dehydrogenase